MSRSTIHSLTKSSITNFPCRRNAGFSLVEVMVAMVVLAFGILGMMGTFQWAERGLQEGVAGTTALAMAESRLEAKRAIPWRSLLTDDMDGDGVADVHMQDDGRGDDERSGDGQYTASVDEDGVHLVWTVQPDRPGPLHMVGSVVIQARASYLVANGQRRSVRLGTLRANPSYIGKRGALGTGR